MSDEGSGLSIGLVIMPTDFGADMRDVARALEDRGFESLFFPEHTHIPWSRKSEFPQRTALPKVYWHNLDPFVTMASAVAVTEHLRFGTSICLLAQRDPITTAKTLATIDHLSGGRIELGVGAGWNVEEMVNHGVPPERRWAVVHEHAEAMREIWRNDHASYRGEFVAFDDIASWPKPILPNGVPILIGGDGKHTASRIATYGDGWIPVLDWELQPLLARIATVRSAVRDRGKNDFAITVAYGYRREIRGSEIERLEQAGIRRILLAVDSLRLAETLDVLDSLSLKVAPWLRR